MNEPAGASPGPPELLPIMDLARRLQARVRNLANAEQVRNEQQRLDVVRSNLERAVSNLRSRTEKLAQVRECGLNPVIEKGGGLDAELRAVAERDFDQTAMNGLITSANDLGRTIDEAVRTAWSRYVESVLPDLDGQETLAKALRKVGGPTAKKAAELSQQVDSLRLVKDSTFSPLNFRSVTNGAQTVNTLASELAPSNEVREFLVAMTAGGAPLSEYVKSPSIQAWMEENQLLESLRVVARLR